MKRESSKTGAKIAVIDTETNIYDEVMSVGLVVADAESLEVCSSDYYIITPEYKKGGMYFYQLNLRPYELVQREDAVEMIKQRLSEWGVFSIYAYNACFDYRHLPELSSYSWRDIMGLAAYRQHNPFITEAMPVCRTGRLRRDYGVESMLRLLSGDCSYCETHNAICDAEDELAIIRLLPCDLEAYPSINAEK